MRVALKRILLVGCFGLAVLSAPASHGQRKQPWEKGPGPIAGRWRVTCAGAQGMVVEFTLQGDKQTSGRVVHLGEGGKYGYQEGEEIFRLTADDYGDWVGMLKWRGLAGTDRWDPIRFTASEEKLNAAMTTDECYRNMPRM